MARLNSEKLRLTRLQVQANILSLPTGPTPARTANPPLSPSEAASIYSEIARYGFTSFQLVAGGVQVASGDGATVVNLTGTAWSFTEDLIRTAGFVAALDKLALTIDEFVKRFPAPPIHLNQVVDLQARWDGAPGGADAFIEGRFLNAQARTLASSVDGVTYNGAGLRLNFRREPDAPLPPMVRPAPGSEVVETFDLRVEPFLADKTCLFLQATGIFPPTDDRAAIMTRVRFVESLLIAQLAPALSLE